MEQWWEWFEEWLGKLWGRDAMEEVSAQSVAGMESGLLGLAMSKST